MDLLDKSFSKIIEDTIRKHPEIIDKLDFDDLYKNVVSDVSAIFKKALYDSAQKMLKEHRKLSGEFKKRNAKRWGKGFDLLETLIVICIEAGEEFNFSNRLQAVKNNDVVFDLAVRHHAKACQIAKEILCLLENGYSDGAHARWRALHEVNATTMFITKHGQDCAERFAAHHIIESYKAMIELNKYEARLNANGFSVDEISECKKSYDELIEKYGIRYKENYGWSAHIFNVQNINGKLGIATIEKDVGLDHMRPYYRWASQNIHSGSNSIRNRLALCETEEDILLVGQSNSGMTDPAQATAISLSQATLTLLKLNPTLDIVILMNIISEISDEIGEIFISLDKPKLN